MSNKAKIKVHRKFDNIQEFMDRLKTPFTVNNGASKTPTRDFNWDSGIDYNGAIKLLTSGWAEGADKITDLSTSVENTNSGYINLPSFQPSEIGEIVEPSAYSAGEPECFYSQEISETKIPVIKIGIPTAMSGGASATDIMNRGIALLSLINAIENNRINTELWVIQYNSGTENNHLLYEIKVKASDEPFDIDKLAYICAHPTFLRRLIFAMKEHESKEDCKIFGVISGGYGTPETYISKDYDLLPDYNLYAFNTKEKCNQWIINNAKKVGIEIDVNIEANN